MPDVACPSCRLSVPLSSLETHLRRQLRYPGWECALCGLLFWTRGDAAEHFTDLFSPHAGQRSAIVEAKDPVKHKELQRLYKEVLERQKESPAGKETSYYGSYQHDSTEEAECKLGGDVTEPIVAQNDMNNNESLIDDSVEEAECELDGEVTRPNAHETSNYLSGQDYWAKTDAYKLDGDVEDQVDKEKIGDNAVDRVKFSEDEDGTESPILDNQMYLDENDADPSKDDNSGIALPANLHQAPSRPKSTVPDTLQKNDLICRLCNTKCLFRTRFVHIRRNHMSVKPYGCAQCPYKTKLKNPMVVHLAKHHSIDASHASAYIDEDASLLKPQLDELIKECFGTLRVPWERKSWEEMRSDDTDSHPAKGASRQEEDLSRGHEEDLPADIPDDPELPIQKHRITCRACLTPLIREDMWRHIVSQHSGRHYACASCPYAARAKDSMRRHLRARHALSLSPAAFTFDAKTRKAELALWKRRCFGL